MKINQRGENGILLPEVKRFLDDMEEAGEEMSPVEVRNDARKSILETWTKTDRAFRGIISEKSIKPRDHRIPLRIYTPSELMRFPVMVFYHGGGWMQCDLDTHDQMCRLFATFIPCIVVSVDYRLAPEAKYPRGLQDCYDALCWTASKASNLGGDPYKLFVAGDSAGGNLAAAVSIMSRDNKGPTIKSQLLLYPVTDVSSFDRKSYRDYAEGYMLLEKDMKWYRDLYVSEEKQVFEPLISPLLCRNLSELPAASIVTAEFDILRDEGEQYAEKLFQSGVPVNCTRYNGVIHGFLSMDKIIEKSESFCREISEEVRNLLIA